MHNHSGKTQERVPGSEIRGIVYDAGWLPRTRELKMSQTSTECDKVRQGGTNVRQ